MKAEDLISMILILGVIPITVIIALFFLQRAKHKERLELIEKGLDLSTLNRKKDGPLQDPLLWGLLSGGVGSGLFLAYILLEKQIFKDDMILGILAIIFGSIGLIFYHILNRKSKNNV